ncbi:MAG: hypothetical protein ACKVQC_03430 [Elusimicrobiota bacterium]
MIKLVALSNTKFNFKIFYVIPLFVFFGLIHSLFVVRTINKSAPTYDEPIHLISGYSILKKDNFRVNGYHHPPFAEMWSAIPLIFLKSTIPVHHPAWIAQAWDPVSQYRFADAFLYKNKTPPDEMIFWGRFMQLFISLVLGFFLISCAATLGGFLAGLFVAVFWALNPVFISNAALIATDFSFAVFYFLFFYFLFLNENISLRPMSKGIKAGIALGLCVTSKYLAVALFPSLFLVLLFVFFKKQLSKQTMISLFISVLVAVAIIFLIHKGNSIDVMLDGYKALFSRAQSGRSSFFMGNHYTEGNILYFPFLFFVKTPIPVLLGFLILVYLLIKKTVQIPAWVWIPTLTFLFIVLTSKVQIGHRHILALYPFVVLIAALSYARFTQVQGFFFAVMACVWMFWSCWNTSPWFISYFNEFIGGPRHGYKYVTDSNVDWGQGLSELGKELSLSDRENGIFLSYFGVADPHFYGIRYWDVGSDTIAGHLDDSDLNLNPTKLAISVTNLQATYYSDKKIFKWLESLTPTQIVAHSIFIYDLKDHPQALLQLKNMRTRPG